MFIKLKVHPGERRDKLVKKAPDAYEIWTKAPPERGLANASAIRRAIRNWPCQSCSRACGMFPSRFKPTTTNKCSA